MAAPFTLRVQEAVMLSALDKDVRHLVHVLAVSANSKTGRGWLSQQSLADRMGCSERHVRALLADLERPDSRPVRVERRPRFREGRGRTADEWTLVLVEPTNRHAVPVEPSTNRHAVPVDGSGLTGTPRTTNRHATTDQPAHGSGADLRSDLRSDPRRERARVKAWRRVPADWGPTHQHRELARERGVDFELELGKFRDHDFKTPKRDANAAFRNWLKSPYADRVGSNGAKRGPAPVSTTYETSDDFGGLT